MPSVINYGLQIKRLLKLSKEAADSLMRGHIQPILDYMEQKKIFMIQFATDDPFIYIDNNDERDLLKKVLRSETPADRLIEMIVGSADIEFDFDELSSLASDLFYSWFCGEAYVEAMIKIDRLVFDRSPPTEWQEIFAEARRCLAFQQYLAVIMVCRLLLERCVVSILGNKAIKNKFGNFKYRDCFRIISKNNIDRQNELLALYSGMSDIVHGINNADEKLAQVIIRRTVLAVEFMVSQKEKFTS